ncbi:hypothetical protein LOTGIDRAFT_163009 [Lottia gigantea]|uniref:C2H2-type domain-containing protein n=1 Tax=Lottia gigantea TaxID=225164 RepID=V3ZKW5_LOTGI|nr:hypothetical protein LOTGIDRAFT_163009 [Lottia gigantea]ESO92003.1 hypothetical protein LOTGIDRAFT_163009 [Lottia gigantea]
MVLSSLLPTNVTDYTPRPKRTRFESPKHYDSGGSGPKELELCDVITLLRSYADYGGGVNCSVCGKLYKSKVCFIKHIWEHSVYWDLFDGAKNHERVLSIQAALILYSGNNDINLNGTDSLMNLLVTAPNTPEKKKENDQSPQKNKPRIDKFPKMESSPLKRKRSD